MSITSDDVKKIAHLARIAVNDDSISQLTDEFNKILSLVDELQQINTDGIEPLAHPLDMTQRLREDTVSEPNVREAAQAIAPKVEAGLYLVPKVIE